MGLTSKLKSTEKFALDTNIFIYAAAKESPFKTPALDLLDYIRKKSPKTFISVIVLEEFFIRMYRLGTLEKFPYYMDLVTAGDSITLVNVTREITLKAAKIRAQFNLKAPDAIHLASAIESGAKTFITIDRRIPKKINGLAIKTLE